MINDLNLLSFQGLLNNRAWPGPFLVSLSSLVSLFTVTCTSFRGEIPPWINFYQQVKACTSNTCKKANLITHNRQLTFKKKKTNLQLNLSRLSGSDEYNFLMNFPVTVFKYQFLLSVPTLNSLGEQAKPSCISCFCVQTVLLRSK